MPKNLRVGKPMIDFLVIWLIVVFVFALYIGTRRPTWKKGNGIITKNAKVGNGTTVWHYVNLFNCDIGTDCIIGSYSEIGGIIGDRCKIECGVFIPKGVVISDEVFIGPHVCFTNDKFPRILEDWKISETWVKKGASIGANATIRCGVTIGKYAMIGCGAIITKDVPDYAVVVGTNKIIDDVRNRKT